MTSARAYRAARAAAEAFAELQRHAGTQFDGVASRRCSPRCLRRTTSPNPRSRSCSGVSWLAMRKRCAPWIVLLLAAAPASAQQARPSVLAVDSGAESTSPSTRDGNHVTGVFLDSLITADFGRGSRRCPTAGAASRRNGEWNRQIWIAEVRYERAGPVAFASRAGTSRRRSAWRTSRCGRTQPDDRAAGVALHVASLPRTPGAARQSAGRHVSARRAGDVSATHWDARVAVIDTSPMRVRRVFGDPNSAGFRGNPPRFTNVVVGGGVTPFVGFRVGASVAQGGWLRAGESRRSRRTATRTSSRSNPSSRSATRASPANGCTTRSRRAWGPRRVRLVRAGRADTRAAMVRGRPRRKDRHDRCRSPSGRITPSRTFPRPTKQTLGFRLTPEITLRVSHRCANRSAAPPGITGRGLGRVVPALDVTAARSTGPRGHELPHGPRPSRASLAFRHQRRGASTARHAPRCDLPRRISLRCAISSWSKGGLNSPAAVSPDRRSAACADLLSRRRLGRGDLDTHDVVCRQIAVQALRSSSRSTIASPPSIRFPPRSTMLERDNLDCGACPRARHRRHATCRRR